MAPIFGDDGRVAYYLPPGRWTSLLGGAAVDGGSWRTETHGYMSLPVMVRPNSIIALGSDETRPDYDYADGVTFHVFEPADGVEGSAAVVSTEGREETSLRVKRDGRTLVVQRRGGKNPGGCACGT